MNNSITNMDKLTLNILITRYLNEKSVNLCLMNCNGNLFFTEKEFLNSFRMRIRNSSNR